MNRAVGGSFDGPLCSAQRGQHWAGRRYALPNVARHHRRLTAEPRSSAVAKATGQLEQFVVVASSGRIVRGPTQTRATRASPRMKQVAGSCCASLRGKDADKKPHCMRTPAKQRPDALQKMPVQPLADLRGRSVTMAAGPHASSSPAISWSDIGDFGQVRSHQSSQGLLVSPSLHPPGAKPHTTHPSRYTWYPKHGLARSPIPFCRPAGPIITLSGCRRGALDFFLLLPSA